MSLLATLFPETFVPLNGVVSHTNHSVSAPAPKKVEEAQPKRPPGRPRSSDVAYRNGANQTSKKPRTAPCRTATRGEKHMTAMGRYAAALTDWTRTKDLSKMFELSRTGAIGTLYKMESLGLVKRRKYGDVKSWRLSKGYEWITVPDAVATYDLSKNQTQIDRINDLVAQVAALKAKLAAKS